MGFREKISITRMQETGPGYPRMAFSKSVFYGMLLLWSNDLLSFILCSNLLMAELLGFLSCYGCILSFQGLEEDWIHPLTSAVVQKPRIESQGICSLLSS